MNPSSHLRNKADYWLKSGGSDAFDEQVSAARLRGTLDASMAFEVTAERLFKTSFSAFNYADGALFDSATGGAFEGINRKADPQRAIEVMQFAHRLRSLLRDQRRKLYWAH